MARGGNDDEGLIVEEEKTVAESLRGEKKN
jgi:hypothetical protein